MARFSNSAWANRIWQPTQHEEANWLGEATPAKQIKIREIVADRLAELRQSKRVEPAVTPETVRYVHRSLFSQLHWAAGDYRGTPISETSSDAVQAMGSRTTERVGRLMEDLFNRLKVQRYIRGLPKEEFVFQEANLINAIVNRVSPFYYGNHLVTKFIAQHVAEHAGHKFDLLTVSDARFVIAIKEAEKNDLVPLRDLVRSNSRPHAAIIFEAAMRSGNWFAILEHPRFKPAQDIVLEAIGDFNGRWRIAADELSTRERAIIRRVQSELDAGRLRDAPTGSDRAWHLGKNWSRDP